MSTTGFELLVALRGGAGEDSSSRKRKGAFRLGYLVACARGDDL